MNKKITSEIFRDDPYKKECKARILDFGDNWIILDQTVFYAEGGGQLGDTGLIRAGQKEIQIENTIKENDLIKHIFNSKFDCKIGDNVTCISKRRGITQMLWLTLGYQKSKRCCNNLLEILRMKK